MNGILSQKSFEIKDEYVGQEENQKYRVINQWEFIKNQVALILGTIRIFIKQSPLQYQMLEKLAQKLEANQEYLKDMFAYQITTPVLI